MSRMQLLRLNGHNRLADLTFNIWGMVLTLDKVLDTRLVPFIMPQMTNKAQYCNRETSSRSMFSLHLHAVSINVRHTGAVGMNQASRYSACLASFPSSHSERIFGPSRPWTRCSTYPRKANFATSCGGDPWKDDLHHGSARLTTCAIVSKRHRRCLPAHSFGYCMSHMSHLHRASFGTTFDFVSPISRLHFLPASRGAQRSLRARGL
ncbi:hypothetical protein C8Q74DRAFT_732192 [Fomes fomentarius]|nr:hypothetical protein C8Q74DRAFT_732192 [Fomes fomentarius]